MCEVCLTTEHPGKECPKLLGTMRCGIDHCSEDHIVGAEMQLYLYAPGYNFMTFRLDLYLHRINSLANILPIASTDAKLMLKPGALKLVNKEQ